MQYQKIIVIGCPGSGKSYFSKQIARITNIPLYHLDVLYWKPNWEASPREEFIKIIENIVNSNEWIIDGNYGKTLEKRFKAAELVYFLDLPTDVCLESVKKRIGIKRSDLPSYLEEKEDLEFISFIENFPNAGRPLILSLIDKYPNLKVITFKSRDEVNEYLRKITDEAYSMATEVIDTLIMRQEKILPKLKTNFSQVSLVNKRLKAFYLSKGLLNKKLDVMTLTSYSLEDLQASLFPILSTINKCEKIKLKLKNKSGVLHNTEKILKALKLVKNLVIEEINTLEKK